MADLFFYRDGTVGSHRASKAHHVSMAKLLDRLTAFETRYFVNPPDLNAAHGPARENEPYRHVVVRVEDGEINGSFPEAGYYHVAGMTPEDCREMFGIKD